MVILGLLLIVLGAAAVLSAVFTAEVHGDHVRLLGGIDMSPLALFLVGLAAGIAIWWGLRVFRWGFRRDRARRKEQRRINRLADQVDQVEEKRRLDSSDDIREAERDNRRTL